MGPLESSLPACAGVGAATLQVLGFALIALAIGRGRARPNRYSWLIWSLVATLAAASSWQAGATWPLAGAVMNALGCVLVLGLALRHGCRARNHTDTGCLLVAIGGVALWLIADDPILGLLLFLVADASGAVPTMRSVLLDPGREDVAGWAILAAAGAASVLSVEWEHWVWSWSGFGHWGAAVYVAAVNGSITASIVLRRQVQRLTARPAPT